MKILVQAKPWSKKEWIEKIWKDLLTWYDIYKVKVSAKPIKWEANKAIVEKLAQYFKVPKSKIIIEKGGSSKYKLISIKF